MVISNQVQLKKSVTMVISYTDLRGAFLEYNYYLYTLTHELEYDSIMDWDQALLEQRKNGEWDFDQPIPSTSDIKNHWRVKEMADLSCIFCGKRKSPPPLLPPYLTI